MIVTYAVGQQRRLSGNVGAAARRHATTAPSSALTLLARRAYAILKQLSVEPSVSINRVELPAGELHRRG